MPSLLAPIARTLISFALALPLLSWWVAPDARAVTSPPPFNWPAGLATTGQDVWVANSRGNSVTEFDTRSGVIVRTIASSKCRFNSPYAMAIDGGDLWVANSNGHTVTELSATSGRLIRVVDPSGHPINYPFAIASGDGHIWVSSGGNLKHNASVFELNPSTGSTVRILTKGLYAVQSLDVIGHTVWVGNTNDVVAVFNADSGAPKGLFNLSGIGAGVEPQGFAPFRGYVWVANGSDHFPGVNYSMVELNSSDGSVVKKILAESLHIAPSQGDPSAVGAYGKSIWITTGNKVVEMNAMDGAREHVFDNGSLYGFSSSDNLVVSGHTLWIANGTGGNPPFLGSVTEMDLPSGGLVRIVH